MKIRFAILSLCLAASLYAHEGHDDEVATFSYQVARAPDIKAWIDSGKQMVILDARTKEYDDAKRLPGAKALPYNVSEEEIKKAIPSKETTVVVYCSNSRCPASKLLTDRLVEMGYKNVFKYTDGLADWEKRGYPTEEAK